MNILQELADSRKEDLPVLKDILREFSEDTKSFRAIPKHRPLSAVLKDRTTVGIIAELKAASPSQGAIRTDATIEGIPILEETVPKIPSIIQDLLAGGAIALSVLTEPRKFKGSFGNLRTAAETAPESVPILLKDFIIDDTQLELGQLCGASNALLIASLGDPLAMAQRMLLHSLEPLVEIHNREDLELIKPLKGLAEPFVIGINNRNLKDFSISFDPTRELVPLIREMFGDDQPIITESGVFSRADMLRMEMLGVKAALIGTSIMQSADIQSKVKSLLGIDRPFIKICGLHNESILESIDPSVITAIGVVVDVPKSHRNMVVNGARVIFQATPLTLLKVLVTKDKSPEEIVDLDQKLQPDLIQNHGSDILNQVGEYSSSLQSKMIIPIKIRSGDPKGTAAQIHALPKTIFAILFDSSEGSGKPMEAQLLKPVLDLIGDRRIILAGGIGSHNIRAILESIQPFGVDASSFLETGDKKDPVLIGEFISVIQSVSN